MPPHALTLPRRVRFGRGEALAAIPEIIGGASRIALVHGRDPSRAAALKAGLEGAGATVATAACPGEPTTDMLAGALDALRGHGAERVVAIGGGAALDLGKALAALLPAPHADPMRHLEVIGQGLPLDADPLPFIALPTTAGTGSEATRNAVIASPEHRRKVSLRDTRLVAELAVLDPALTDGAPRGVTMASGLDAVTQVIEPYLSRNANPFTDALCREAIPRGLRAMAALARGEDPGARDEILWVAHVSGIALANAGLGAVHGLAGVMGGETGEAHGAICGLLLPHILLANRAALPADAPVATRFAEVEAWMQDALGVGFDGLAGWARDAGLAPPAARLTAEQRLGIADRSAASSSMKPNPVPLPAETLAQALEDAGWG
ncbi:iron-containing alcohol dehydrogenase [Rhodovulum sp. DZ06]|uniref:iron-containing alcohol dehydrogenase n=1 Tax=Rhodovulum sp. DZ06 TaxID=3425126 RepID=UPI003D339FEC